MFTKPIRLGTLNVRYSVCDFMAPCIQTIETIVTNETIHSSTETNVQQAAQRTYLCLRIASRETSTTWAPSSSTQSALVMAPISWA